MCGNSAGTVYEPISASPHHPKVLILREDRDSLTGK